MCFHYNKGFCKLKGQSPTEHPFSACQGQCNDKKTCAFWHVMLWQNGGKCIFLSSQACEFLHTKNSLEKYDSIEIVQNHIAKIKGFVQGIEEKLNTLDIPPAPVPAHGAGHKTLQGRQLGGQQQNSKTD